MPNTPNPPRAIGLGSNMAASLDGENGAFVQDADCAFLLVETVRVVDQAHSPTDRLRQLREILVGGVRRPQVGLVNDQVCRFQEVDQLGVERGVARIPETAALGLDEQSAGGNVMPGAPDPDVEGSEGGLGNPVQG